MKTIRVTFTKGEAKATCLMKFRFEEGPESAEWSGDRDAFRTPAGYQPEHFGTTDSVEPYAQHFAGLCGATAKVEDLGGEAIPRIL